MNGKMINKVECFFSTYNIIIGITITILAIYTVELIKSISIDIITKINYCIYMDDKMYITKTKEYLRNLYIKWEDIDGRTPIYRTYQIV